jgi:hypothetical protein
MSDSKTEWVIETYGDEAYRVPKDLHAIEESTRRDLEDALARENNLRIDLETVRTGMVEAKAWEREKERRIAAEKELAAPRDAVEALIEAGSFLSESVSRLAGDIDCRCGPDGVCDDHERIRAWWIALARCKAATEGEG